MLSGNFRHTIVIILALNEVGRVNLYTLISMSHLKSMQEDQEFQRANCRNTEKDFWWEVPVRRENVYQAILNEKSEDESQRS